MRKIVVPQLRLEQSGILVADVAKKHLNINDMAVFKILHINIIARLHVEMAQPLPEISSGNGRQNSIFFFLYLFFLGAKIML